MNHKHFFLTLLGVVLSASMMANITLNMQRVRLDAVFAQITEQTGLKVSYSSPTVDPARIVSIQAKNETTSAVLDKLLDGMGLKYEITSKEIILSAVPAPAPSKNAPMMQMGGVVVDATGEPVIGASIVVKGTTTGTVTDFDGQFSIDAPKGSKLQFSYIGYTTIELAGAADMKVTLKEDNELLDEVVVVGYGTQKRVNLTGAVSTIDEKTLSERPVPSAVQALQGADPSLNITPASGDPAAGYDMNIRGMSSLTSGASPLVLIDGVEGSLTRLNANDIESVSILKDASAAAVYGARASAGVVLITTKNGKEGKINVSYDGRVGWAQNTTSTDYITTGFWNAYINDLFMRSYQKNGYSTYTGFEDALTDNKTGDYAMLWERVNDKTENPDRPWVLTDENGTYQYYANFDWYNHLYKQTRLQHEHNVTIKGGNDKINFYVSGRYYHQDGMMNVAKDPYDNMSLRSKINAKINSWLSYSNNTSFFYSKREYPGITNMASQFKQSYVHAMASIPAYNPDGTATYINTMSSNSYTIMDGMSATVLYNKHKNVNTDREIRTTNRFEITPIKQLKIVADYTYAFRYRLYENRQVNVPYSKTKGVIEYMTTGSQADWYQEQHYRTNDHNLNIFATYEDTFKDAHHLTVMVGGQYESFRADNMKMRKEDLASEDLNAFDLATGEVTVSTGSINEWSTLGFFGRVNYDYKGRYLAEFSARGDGSSRFAPENRWGFFPSGSLGWRMSEESWWEPVARVWTNNKVRFSAGALGNQQISDYYTYIETMNLNQTLSYAFDPNTYAYYSREDDPKAKDLTWETTVTYDLGWDVGLFRNRLNLSVDGYIRDTKNMLVDGMALCNIYGASVPKSNISDMRTMGWELSIGWNDRVQVCGKPFEYNVSFGIGDYKTKVTRYNNPSKIIDTTPNNGSNIYYEGQTLGEIWGYEVDGLFASDEEAAAYDATMNTAAVDVRIADSYGEPGYRAGDMKFVDQNGDNIINMGSSTLADHGDLKIIGNALPRFSYNLKFGMNWYGVDLSLFFQGIGHQDWYPNRNSLAFWGPYTRPYCTFIPTNFMDNVWSETNTDAYFPRPRGYIALNENGPLGVVNDRYLQNVAYFRLKNMTLGYTFPIPKNKVVESLRIYFSGENLFYFSPLKKHTKYIDPEQATSTSTADTNSGIAYNFSRTLSIGLNVVF